MDQEMVKLAKFEDDSQKVIELKMLHRQHNMLIKALKQVADNANGEICQDSPLHKSLMLSGLNQQSLNFMSQFSTKKPMASKKQASRDSALVKEYQMRNSIGMGTPKRSSQMVYDTTDNRLLTEISAGGTGGFAGPSPKNKAKRMFPPIFSGFANNNMTKTKFSMFFGRHNKIRPMNDQEYHYEIEEARKEQTQTVPFVPVPLGSPNFSTSPPMKGRKVQGQGTWSPQYNSKPFQNSVFKKPDEASTTKHISKFKEEVNKRSFTTSLPAPGESMETNHLFKENLRLDKNNYEC
jgi:hypothetical protein